jgi:hypothetical protein
MRECVNESSPYLTLYAIHMCPELITVLHCLSEHGYSISLLVKVVLASQAYDLRNQILCSARDHLERKAVDICAYLFHHTPTSALISSWALQSTQLALRTEAEELMKKEHGQHFCAKTATMEQVEALFMPQPAEKMWHVAPSIWRLVFTLVGALDERCPYL